MGFFNKFFTKYYLTWLQKTTKFKKIICNKYEGPLKEPYKNLSYYLSLFIDKAKRFLITDQIYKNK